MSITNFPNGVSSFGIPVLGSGEVFTTGNVFFVDSGSGSNGNSGTEPAQPFASVDYAVGRCTVNNGDKIVVMPGHTETVTATSIALDVAGISIVCIGNGTDQPTFTYSAATSTITASAANIKWIGGKFVANKLDVASAFTLSTATNFTLAGSLSVDSTAILNFLSIVTTGATDNAADDLTVIDNTWYGLNTTPLAFVSILAAALRPTVSRNYADLAATGGGEFITLAAKIVNGARFQDNVHTVVGATGVTTGIFLTGSGSTSTGIVSGNLVSSLDTTTELIATAGTGLIFHENYYTGTADKSGKLWPVVDTA